MMTLYFLNEAISSFLGSFGSALKHGLEVNFLMKREKEYDAISPNCPRLVFLAF